MDYWQVSWWKRAFDAAAKAGGLPPAHCPKASYRRDSRFALLLCLVMIWIVVSATARANSAAQPSTGSPSIDSSCNISLTPVRHSTADATVHGSEVSATCVRYPAPLIQGAIPSATAKGNAELTSHSIVGYALPVTIIPGDGLTLLSVRNPSDRAIALKAEVREWHQDAFGQDVFVASSVAVISPSRLTIVPGGTNQFSVQLPKPAERELAFRIMLQQLPEDAGIYTGQILPTITQSLPAFSESAQPQKMKLRARRIDAQYLLITNDGGRRARLITITSNGQVVAAGLVSHALAHSSVLVKLTSPMHGQTVDIETDQGHQFVEVR
jgi:P pilus assembly chaperone PapD